MMNYIKQKLVNVFAIFIVFMAAFSGTAYSQTSLLKSSEGTDFTFSFSPNHDNPAVQLQLFVSSTVNTTGTVFIPKLGMSIPFEVNANVATSIDIPAAMAQSVYGETYGTTYVLYDAYGKISNFAIYVNTKDPVNLYALNYKYATTDGFLVLPESSLGKEYFTMNYTGLSPYDPSQIGIVGVKDNTKITITSPIDTLNGKANVPYAITLNRHQTYFIAAKTGYPDLTGTKIVADKPIAITSGAAAANVPRYGYGAADHLVEMMPSTDLWGKNFVSQPLMSRLKGDLIRVLASKDNTKVYINKILMATLASGTYFDSILTSASQIETSEPSLVAQFALGSDFDNVRDADPFMMLLVPTEQFKNIYTFSTPTARFSKNFINLVIPSANASSVQLDGVSVDPSLFKPIPGSELSGASLAVSVGSHTVSAPISFGLYMYGFAAYESYGYPGGMLTEKINLTTVDYRNVRVVSKLSNNDIDLDVNSFSVAPTRIEKLSDRTEIEWSFPQFSIGQIKDLDYEVVAKNLKAGERRIVTSSLTMEYEDLNGVKHQQVLGEQNLAVMGSGFSLSLTTDSQSYAADKTVYITAQIVNLGAAQSSVTIQLNVIDSSGKEVISLAPQPVISLGGKQTLKLDALSFSTGKLYAGNYFVHAILKDSKGDQVALVDTPFTIIANLSAQAAAQVTTNKLAYSNQESVEILGRINNLTANVLIENITLATRVLAENGSDFWSDSSIVAQILPQALSDKKYSVPLAGAAAGKYRVVFTALQKDGSILASSETLINVAESPLVALKSAAMAGKVSINTGDGQTCIYSIANQSSNSLTAQTITMSVVRVEDETLILNATEQVDLVSNQTLAKMQNVPALLLKAGTYACSLQILENGKLTSLAQGLFTVKALAATLDGSITLGDKLRLLVLLDPSLNAQPSAKEIYIRSLLDGAGWKYTLVNNAASFKTELINGGYGVFALLSEKIELDSFTQGLLKLQTDVGDGLIVAGNLGNKNTQLEEALGITARANVTYNKGVGLQFSPLGDAWERAFTSSVPSLSFTAKGSSVIGEYRNNVAGGVDSSVALGAFGTASNFNAFVFENFTSLSSTVGGRLAVGGNLGLQNFSVGDKLNPNSLADVVLVGGNASFDSGRVYYGNLLAGGSVAGVTNSVIYGMAKGAVVKGNRPLPFNMVGEQEYLRELSLNIAALPANGSVTLQWGGYQFKGDCTKSLQVFNVKAIELASANSAAISCIPAGATVIFNVVGENAAIQNIGLQALASIRDKVLFNFPQATSLILKSVGVEGSILAPLASVNEPAGNINGQLIAKSWQSTTRGYMSINNYSFKGDLSAAMGASTKNAVAIYQYQTGRSVFIGFDVLEQAMLLQNTLTNNAPNPFAQLLMSSLNYIQPSPLTTKATKVIPFVVKLQNKGESAVTGKAILRLGNALTMISADGFSASTTTLGEWVYPYNMEGSASVSKTIYVQMPPNVGDLSTLKLQLQTGSDVNSTIQFQAELPVTAQ